MASLLARGAAVRAGELALVMDSERVLSADIHAVWPNALYMPAKTRAAVDLLAARIPQMLSAQFPALT